MAARFAGIFGQFIFGLGNIRCRSQAKGASRKQSAAASAEAASRYRDLKERLDAAREDVKNARGEAAQLRGENKKLKSDLDHAKDIIIDLSAELGGASGSNPPKAAVPARSSSPL